MLNQTFKTQETWFYHFHTFTDLMGNLLEAEKWEEEKSYWWHYTGNLF